MNEPIISIEQWIKDYLADLIRRVRDEKAARASNQPPPPGLFREGTD